MSINIESSFSFKGSLIQESSLKELKQFGYKSLGLVDDNTAFFYAFYKQLLKEEIKPILGLRQYGKYYDYILYPINFSGYKEVLYYRSLKDKNAIISAADLIKSENILYVFDLTKTVADNINYIKEEYEYLKENNLKTYMGVDFSYYPCETGLYPFIKDDFDFIILDKVKYLYDDDKLASDVLESILTGKELREDNIFDLESSTFYSLSKHSEYLKQYRGYEDLIENTENFKNKINIIIKYDNALPKYPIKDDIPTYIYLKKLAEKGLEKRLLNHKNKDVNTYKKRLYYELDQIHNMGFDDYFLVVYDFILYAKKNGIMVGPGRGSAASSLVSYSLGIVDVDPLEYNLYFERFLNPSRKTMPDIDTDFEDNKRDEVIRYVSKKYGETHVSLIATFQTFLAKSSIRDVSKILNIPNEKVNLILKEITGDNSIDDLLNNDKIKDYSEKDEDFKNIMDVSRKIEGLPRSIGTHAAGVIISDKDLREYSEIEKSNNGFIMTAYDSDTLKDIGLLKMDFLALRNLTIIHDIINDIKESKNITINLSKINLKDEATFNLLQNFSTTGIFQLESPGMEKLLKQMKVKDIEDLALCIALFRPGPMDSIPLYLKRREGKEKIDYYDESIKNDLVNTLGIIVYQEQTMSIVSKYAGLSLSDADIIRRAMSSKDASLMDEIKDKFFDGARKMKRREETTLKLFNDILKFAGYGFNKAHAISYALIAYELAYLKAHYPAEFMANLLKNTSSVKYIKECAVLNIRVLPPDLRYSSFRYITVGKNIYMPFTSIKGVGYETSKNIQEIARSSNFVFEEFVRLSKKVFSRSLLETLIMAGIFDYSNYSKKTMIESLDGLYEFDPSIIKGLSEDYKIKDMGEYDFDYLKKTELDLLGYNPKYHPIKNYKGNLPKLSDMDDSTKDTIKMVAYLTGIKELKTRNKDVMASLTIEDEYRSMNAVIFPSDYLKILHLLKNNEIYEISGYFSLDNRGNKQFVIRKIEING